MNGKQQAARISAIEARQVQKARPDCSGRAIIQPVISKIAGY